MFAPSRVFANRRTVNSLIESAAILAVAILIQCISTPAYAATHEVASGVSALDCSSFAGGVRPGDTLILAGRSRGSIKISNCVGTSTNPIVITNDTTLSGPLVVEQSGDGFQTQCEDCEYVVIDGTGKWNGAPAGDCGASLVNGEWKLGIKQCGIVLKCVSGSPHSGLRISGGSKHVTVKGVEIDANFPTCKKGIGLSVNDHKYTPKAGEWREGIKLIHNYVHGTEGEGIYVGPNQSASYADTMQLRNNEIAYNYLDRSGCDAINYKSAVAGSSSIHHNYITNTGQTHRGGEDGCTGSGIDLWESGFTDVYSNYVEAPSPNADGQGNCINVAVKNLSGSKVNSVPVKVYNNVVRNCRGNAISVARGSDTAPELSASVFNNTIVPPFGGKGINVGSSVSSCSIRDNIVAGGTLAAAKCAVANNSTEPVSEQRFRDVEGRDFRLTASSPAVDVGTGNCPDTDHIGTARPQEGACDVGAFEYKSSDAAATKPSPPMSVAVE